MGIPGALTPALLNRKSSRPNASLVFAKSASTDAGSLTSAGAASARSPSAPASAFVFARGSGRRPASTTDHPSPSIASAEARPTPVPAPVIIATFPCPSIPHSSSECSISKVRHQAKDPGRRRPESSRRTPGSAIAHRRSPYSPTMISRRNSRRTPGSAIARRRVRAAGGRPPLPGRHRPPRGDRRTADPEPVLARDTFRLLRECEGRGERQVPEEALPRDAAQRRPSALPSLRGARARILRRDARRTAPDRSFGHRRAIATIGERRRWQ